LLVAGSLLAMLLTGCASGQQAIDTSMDDGYYGAVLEQQYTAPDITLTDDSGAPYDLRTDTTKPLTLVFFGYTNCPDVCPAVMASLASSLTRLDDDQRAQIQVVFITTDPARDDAKTLHSYVARFDPTFIGLTGSLKEIKAAGNSLGVFIGNGAKLPTGGYDVTHGSQVVALDAHDRSPIVWTEGTSSAQFASDFIRLLDHPLEDT
jgi:protein SCO1